LELDVFIDIWTLLSVVLHLPIGVAVVAALLAHALQADLVQHLLAVQLIQDNHPLPLSFWNIPVYSGSSRIRGDQQDSVDENYMDPDPGPDPNPGLKIVGVRSHEHFCKK
jgi:hypothetical protein